MYRTRRIFLLVMMPFMVCLCNARPTIKPVMSAESNVGEKADTVTTFTGSAPITCKFRCLIEDQEDYSVQYEWRFWHEGGSIDEPYMIRYEEEPEVVFSQAGTDSIAYYAIFVNGVDTVRYQTEYWNDRENQPITLRASESILVFPNAFSPNNDQTNDTYKPKEYKSIVDFKAMIFNRQGQKLYEWTDVTADGWDGKYNGRDVRDGVYYVLVNAQGADGRKFNIKKSVTLLRSFDKSMISSGDAPSVN